MPPFFRRKQDPPAAKPPRHTDPPPADSTQTAFFTGDARRDTDRIKTLVESLREVSSAVDPDELLVKMVDRAVELVGAERGLLFTKGAGQTCALRVGRASNAKNLPRGAAFSTKVVESVWTTGEPVREKIDESGDFDPSRSIIDLAISSIMCVPLVGQKDERLGVLYVDTRSASRNFGHGDLRYFGAIADMLAIIWNTRRAMEERLAAQRMAQDLDLARRIQLNLLPEHPLVAEGYAMVGRVLAAEETGGDYFDFFHTRDDKIALAVGDVSGHGIGAAMIMSAARAYLRGLCESASSPGAILRRLNRALDKDTEDDMFMSMFLCVLDPATGEFHYSNAGHTRPVLLHGGGLETEDYRVTGIALGVEPDSDYEERGPYTLDKGDTVVMFSDGITELRLGDEQYGRERVLESIVKHGQGSADDMLEGVFKDALSWAKRGPGAAPDDPHLDDLTVAVLRADR